MTQFLEKLSTNIYTLYAAIIVAAGGGWFTCAYLTAISAQVTAVGSKVEITNMKVEDLAKGQDQTHAWIKAVSDKVDSNTATLQSHDIVLTRQADKLDEMQRAIDKDAAANRVNDQR